MKPSNTDMYKKVMRLLEDSDDQSLIDDLLENEDELSEYLDEEMPEKRGSVMIMIKKKGKKKEDMEELFPDKDNPMMIKMKKGGAVRKPKAKVKAKKKSTSMTKWERKWG
jgi:hypothetical protein